MSRKPIQQALWVLILLSASCALAQVSTPMEIAKEAALPKDVYDIVAIGGPNDGIQCDAEGNVWIPGLRGYSSTDSSLVRYRLNEPIAHIDIDRYPKFKNGSIEYFSPSRDGGAFLLVRTVAEYDEIDGEPTTPKRYANTFAVKFSPSGTLASSTQLKIPSTERVTALAQLRDGWLVAGYRNDGPLIEMKAYVFSKAGNLTKEITLPESRSKSSRAASVETLAVLRPTALVTSDGSILVFRGFSGQPLYRFSPEGVLLETIKLKLDGINFWSPRLVGNSLFVQLDAPQEELGKMFGIPVVRYRSAYSIFDLKTGGITQVMTWMGYGTVGCFNGTSLQLFKNPERPPEGSTWRILTLEPKARSTGPRA